MFSKLALFAAVSMAVFVAAIPTPGNGSDNGSGSGNDNGSGSGDDNDNGSYGGVEGSCNNGPVQCCNSVQNSNSEPIKTLVSLLGIDVSDITGQVGLGCTPVSVIAIAGNSCTSQSVCCSNNSFNGIVALGCTPINLNL